MPRANRRKHTYYVLSKKPRSYEDAELADAIREAVENTKEQREKSDD